MQDFFAASRPKRVLGVIAGSPQAAPGRRRYPGAGISRGGWVAVAAVALLGGCSWFSDEPSEPPAPVTIDSSGEVPAVTGVPDQPATPEVSVLDHAPQGLASDSASAQYGEELTMPSEQAPRPVPPPPPAEVPPAADAQTPPADGAPTESAPAESAPPEAPAAEEPAPATAPAESVPEAPAPQSQIDQAPMPTAALVSASAAAISSAC